MKKVIFILIFLGFSVSFSQSQGSKSVGYEIRRIVDMPTAGTLEKGTYTFNTVTYDAGGITAEFALAPFTNFMLGLSYGGTGIIGDGEPVFQELPGILISYRILDETTKAPALLLGISTQGKGAWDKGEKRFATMSPGAYFAASKAFKWWAGYVAVHGGLNYSFEPKSDNKTPNFYAGLEHTIGSFASLSFEFNTTLDEKEKTVLDKQGLLNASLRCFLSQSLVFELQMRDLLRHRNEVKSFSRFVGVEYTAKF